MGTWDMGVGGRRGHIEVGYGDTGTWDMGFEYVGDMGTRGYGNLGTWGHGNLGMGGDVGTWGRYHAAGRGCGHPPPTPGPG